MVVLSFCLHLASWRGYRREGEDLEGFQVVPSSLSHLWHTHLCAAQVAFGSPDLCWSCWGSGAVRCVCPGLTLPLLCSDQLALDIDRDVEDQNQSLGGMVRPVFCECHGHLCSPPPAVQPPHVCVLWGRCPCVTMMGFLPQDTDFTSVTGLLTGSVKRFSTMARSGRDNRKLLCGMAVGLIVVFFILSYLLSRPRT